MPSSPARLALWLPAFAVAIAGGWMLGRRAPAEQARTNQIPVPLAPAASASHHPSANTPAARWVTRLRSATLAEFPALFDELHTLFADDEESRLTALKLLFGRWIAFDEKAPLAFAVQQKDSESLQGIVMQLMVEGWPEKAAGILFGTGGNRLAEVVSSNALFNLAELVPNCYLKHDPEGRSQFWNQAVRALSEFDPAAAADVWMKSEVGEEGKWPPFEIAVSWQNVDPAAARRWAESLSGEHRNAALNGWLSSLAHKDPRAALNELKLCGLETAPGKFEEFERMSYDPNYHGSDARQEIAGRLAVKDFAGALAAARELAMHFPHNDRDDPDPETLLRIQQIMTTSKVATLPVEPQALLAALEDVSKDLKSYDPNGRLQSLLMDKVLGYDGIIQRKMSVEECLQAARLRMAAGVPGEDGVLTQFLRTAAFTRSGDVVALINEMPPEAGARMAWSIRMDLDPNDTESGAMVLRKMPPGEWIPELISELRDHLPAYAPVVAEIPGKAGNETRVEYARQWAEIDPAAAVAWAASLPPGSNVETGVAAGWAVFDEKAASQWVSSLPQGSARDRAAAGLVNALASLEPEKAWKWAASIGTPETRIQSLQELAAKWTDAPQEFRAACAAAGISANPSDRKAP